MVMALKMLFEALKPRTKDSGWELRAIDGMLKDMKKKVRIPERGAKSLSSLRKLNAISLLQLQLPNNPAPRHDHRAAFAAC